MVLIINGEIVADNDPRAMARRQRPAASASPRAAAAARAPQGAPSASSGALAPGSPLEALATQLGVQGQSVEIPAVWRLPAREVPMIGVILLGLITLFLGWKVLALVLMLHVFSGLSEAGIGAPAAPRARPAGGPPAR
jgi:hypothetical protein|tara:strand:+ start:653 stop:1066 length:414 start_codon:yes stop_codon:yes gene_type:complete